MGTINYDAPKDIKDCLEKNDLDEWQNISLKKRSEILNQVADSIEKDWGKTKVHISVRHMFYPPPFRQKLDCFGRCFSS